MKRPTFIQGAGLAFVLSFAGAAAFAAVTPFFVTGQVFRLLIAVLAGAYVLYLLARSGEKTGRAAAAVLWMTGATVAWFVHPPLPLYLIVHAGLIWLLRTLYYHSSAVPALFDLGLSGLGLAAGVWAAVQSGSLFMGLWCFFLVQALFVAIPKTLRAPPREEPGDAFQRAHRAAEAAVRRLSTNL